MSRVCLDYPMHKQVTMILCVHAYLPQTNRVNKFWSPLFTFQYIKTKKATTNKKKNLATGMVLFDGCICVRMYVHVNTQVYQISFVEMCFHGHGHGPPPRII
jgi:hypothetical protein